MSCLVLPSNVNEKFTWRSNFLKNWRQDTVVLPKLNCNFEKKQVQTEGVKVEGVKVEGVQVEGVKVEGVKIHN